MTQAVAKEATVTGWSSKAKWEGKAHFVEADGRTACADRIGPYGALMSTLFKTRWVELRPDDHLCTTCQRVHPRECMCGRCRIKAAAATPFTPLPRIVRPRGRPKDRSEKLTAHVPLRLTDREHEVLRTLSVRHPSGSMNGYIRTLIRAAWRRYEKQNLRSTHAIHEHSEKGESK